jgi:hypothetical protein
LLFPPGFWKRFYSIASSGGRPRMKSDAFSAIIMVVA